MDEQNISKIGGFSPSNTLLDVLKGSGKSKGGGLLSALSKNTHTSSSMAGMQSLHSDRVRLSKDLIQKKLAEELEKTLEKGYKKNPELKGEVFIGIVGKQDKQVHVVPLEYAAKNTEELTEEKALEVLQQNPVGFFHNAEDFTLKTPQEEKYQDFAQNLQKYFERFSAVYKLLEEEGGQPS